MMAVLLCTIGAVAVWLLTKDRLPKLVRQLRHESPHQRYARGLHESGLSGTALATEWLAAAARTIEQPVPVAVPFSESALVDPARPLALGYELTLKRGQRLDVEIAVVTDTPGHVFIDLFRRETKATPAPPVASAVEHQNRLSYEARASGAYVLRVQPELLRGGHVTTRSIAAASLTFPVRGASGIQSAFGDRRDAGRRRHEGVDIFAKAGTPVVAASAGVVVSAGENTLGGRVVWVWDMSRQVRYYYAHLQEQLVTTGTFVRAGDVVGTVGNTGNARTTGPHLHFGIYAVGEGAIDPDGFIRPVAVSAGAHVLRTAALGAWSRTRARAPLRRSPSTDAPVLEMLARGSAVRVEGALGSWVRTSVGPHAVGFVAARDLSLEPGGLQ
jgi:murein DD-endopeptidase MepM/ murein hydrolase activator NlpD